MSSTTYSIYDPVTGLFVGRRLTCPAEHAHLNIGEGHAAVEGVHDHLSKRIDIERLAREDSDALTAWQVKKDAGEECGERPPRPVATAAHVIDHIPAQPSEDHEWNAQTKRWELTPACLARQAASGAAAAERTSLRLQQHDLVREVVLNPSNSDALSQLRGIHDRLQALKDA